MKGIFMGEGRKGRQRRGNHKGGLAFFKGFLRHPELVGSVIPSSRFLEKRIVDAAVTSSTRFVVELGPGTGGTTRAILNSLPDDAILLAIEINPKFATMLKTVDDPRLVVHLGSAENIQDILKSFNGLRPDAVISGIPFSTMPPARGGRILEAVWSSLAPGGFFVAYQFRRRVAELGKKSLGKPETEMEFLNVPPVRLFRWRKPPASKKIIGD
jgi:phospholipid N-methyltransferase